MPFDFQHYDPSKPRMVTSFKGNQKLIFEGYRYNIHHIVEAKGVKTWRCVCAKKLTSQRSWCKGRAETWDKDNQGLSKGDHNHDPEHEDAELEYFKSQLILAAIKFPTANLNDLIDESATFMSPGLNFGSSRESLKKSLTVARKASENGGFKMKCYKNSGSNGTLATAASMVYRPQQTKQPKNKVPKEEKLIEEQQMSEDSVEDADEASLSFLSTPLSVVQKPVQRSNQARGTKSTESQIASTVDMAAIIAQFAQNAVTAANASKMLSQPVVNAESQSTLNPTTIQPPSKKRFASKTHDDSGFADSSPPPAKRSNANNRKRANANNHAAQSFELEPEQSLIASNTSPFLSINFNNAGNHTPTSSCSVSSNAASSFDLSSVIDSQGGVSNANALLAMALQFHATLNNGVKNNNSGAQAQSTTPAAVQQQLTLKNVASKSSSAGAPRVPSTMGNHIGKAHQNNLTPSRTSSMANAVKRKKAERINNISNKLSTKIAAAVSATENNGEQKLYETSAERKTSNVSSSTSISDQVRSPPQFCTFANVTTQTEGNASSLLCNNDMFFHAGVLHDSGKIRLSGCLRSKMVGNGEEGQCECRIIRVCCCSDATNCKKRDENNASGISADEEALGQAEKHSPSSTSSALLHGDDQVERLSEKGASDANVASCSIMNDEIPVKDEPLFVSTSV